VRTPILDLFRPSFHALCRAYFGLELRGVEHIPHAGAVLITPNHQTYADPPLVTIPIRRPVFYMAWSRLFNVPGFGWCIRRLRAFPVQVDSADSRATREVVRLLGAGEAVMIFPEGERSRDGTIGRFKPGAFRLAVSLTVPILPVTIDGGHESWPPGRLLPRPRRRITITYHPLAMPQRALAPREAAAELAERTRTTITAALRS
jgi:1-acyl-sn-glycerol-3-phosphate acyltransferase